MTEQKKRIVIVGGVAGGASCAARLRRLWEDCEIILYDKGEHVSFANCGLPYFVGNVITDEKDLIVATPDVFKARFDIDVFIQHEVIEVDRKEKTLQVKNILNGEVKKQAFDALVLSTGSKAVRPLLPGIDLPGVYVLRSIPDSHKLRAAAKNAKTAVIIGAGFIGLEMAENLAQLGLHVSLIEMAEHVMPPLDPEMAVYIENCLQENGIELLLGKAVQGFEQQQDGLKVHYSENEFIQSDMVLLAIGVTPESTLAKQAGLDLGVRSGIKVDETMQTSDSAIWAVGDVIEVKDFVTGQALSLPLAGPANRQGRIAAGSVYESFHTHQAKLKFRGVQGTSVCCVFGLTIAMTGASEKALHRAGITDYQVIYLHPGHHVGYFPGARPIHMKLLFGTHNGKILGAQALGHEGVARRIDVIAMAIQMGGTVYDLEESELCYAPQFGAAKDPVNMAGMIAGNFLRGDISIADWSKLDETSHLVLDVRANDEFSKGSIPGAINIPIESLRERMVELPKDVDIWVICGVGQRAYYAVRLLMQKGYHVCMLSGGYQTYQAFNT